MGRTIILLALGLLLLAGCVSTFPAIQVAPQVPKPTGDPALTRTDAPSEACVTDNDQVETWVDSNRNGIRELAELPLAAVELKVEATTPRTTTKVDQFITGANGRATFHELWYNSPECISQFFIYPLIPQGYELTTPAKIELQSDQKLQFGFVKSK